MTAPNPEQMKLGVAGVFSRAALTYDQVGPRYFDHFGRGLVRAAQVSPGETVLDVATGRGAVLFPAARQVGPTGQVIGIDLAAGMVEATAAAVRAEGLTNAQVRCLDAEQLDFPDALFDVVTCGFALFFFPNLRATLAQFLRVLKPGGRLAVSTWGRDDERWAWLGGWGQKHLSAQAPRPPRDGPAFNQPAAMQAILQESGLTQVHVIEDEGEFLYADADEWLTVQWSQGMRYWLEAATPEAREQMQAEAFARLQTQRGPRGIPHWLGVLYSLGMKP